MTNPLLEAALRRRLPTVAIDSPAPSAATERCGSVGIDEQSAAEAAADHLLALGHRRLGVLSLRLSASAQPGAAGARAQERATASVARGRLEGAARAAAAANLDWSRVAVEQCQVSDVASGRAGAHALLDRAPGTTALLALSDPLALGARLAARERGLAVPEDLSIVGFADSAGDAEGLTTVHQPLREKGRAAAEQLLRMLAGEEPTRTLLPTRLVVRGSTADAAGG